jgi:integrase
MAGQVRAELDGGTRRAHLAALRARRFSLDRRAPRPRNCRARVAGLPAPHRGAGALDTAHRAHQNCGQIFRYAAATGRAERDPSGDLRGALPPAKDRHHASITDPKAIGDLLRAIEGYCGAFVTKAAMSLAPLAFVRPGELRQAEWAEFDLDGAEWRIPAEKTKMRAPHVVPLSAQAVAILREIRPLIGGGPTSSRRRGRRTATAARARTPSWRHCGAWATARRK